MRNPATYTKGMGIVEVNLNGKNWIAPNHDVSSNLGKSLEARRGILVIDDSSLFQRMLTDILDTAGYPVIGVASCGSAGADLAMTLRPRVIILDHNMPGCDGVQCLQYIRREDPEVKVIICSANLTLDLSREYLAAGADDFLAKPISLRTLFNLLKHYYDSVPLNSRGVKTRR